MSTPATFRWVDPFTGDKGERVWPLASFDASGVVRAMGEIDTHEAGLPPGEGAGYDLVAFAPEGPGVGEVCPFGTGFGSSAAFILRTCGLPGGPESQLLVVGRVDVVAI